MKFVIALLLSGALTLSVDPLKAEVASGPALNDAVGRLRACLLTNSVLGLPDLMDPVIVEQAGG